MTEPCMIHQWEYVEEPTKQGWMTEQQQKCWKCGAMRVKVDMVRPDDEDAFGAAADEFVGAAIGKALIVFTVTTAIIFAVLVNLT